MKTARNLTTTIFLAASLFALSASVAMAERSDNGQGLYGETNDKVVTYAGFLVMTFFVLFVFTMTMIQRKLDKRKEAKVAALEGRDGRFKGGW